jgi:DNA gyrase subunit A
MKGAAGIINVEDLVADEEQVLVLTAGGYVKRTNPEEYKRQKRGGVGVIDLDTKEEDFVTTFLTLAPTATSSSLPTRARRIRSRCMTSRKASARPRARRW